MLISNRTRTWSLLPAVVGVATLVACEPLSAPERANGNTSSRQTPAARFRTTSVMEPETGPWARIVEGEVGPGALYALYIPREWNGDALYYVHGVRDFTEPVDLNDANFTATRDALSAQGFAIAFSSWSQNGEAIKEAVQQVHQLRGILTGQLRRPPSRSFLIGRSMGGGIALNVLQTYPEQYDGALLLCGFTGGTLLENQYAEHVRVLFDAFYPGALLGSAFWYPPDAPFVSLPQVQAAVQSNPTPLFVIASLAQTPLPYVPSGSPLDASSTAFRTLVSSLWTPLWFHSRLVNGMVDQVHGHTFFDNSATTYAIGPNPLLSASQLQPLMDFANANVARYTADPSALNYEERYFTPTGDLRDPVVTLRNTFDPAVPAFHDTAFYHKVAAAGATQNLLQRSYSGYGHCGFSAAVIAQNFVDLVTWVTTGVKPAS